MGAPGPHDFTVRIDVVRQPASMSSTAVRATFVTIAIRPLPRRGMHAANHDLRHSETRMFLREGLDNPNQLETAREIRSVAHGIFGRGLAVHEPARSKPLSIAPDGRIDRSKPSSR